MLALLRANPLVSALGGLGIVLALLLAVQSVRLGHRTNQLERAKTDLNEVKGERDSLIAAAKEAERLNKDQVNRIVTEQDRISDDIEARYKADRERMQRELAERLRRQTDNGHPQGPGASPDGKAPGGPDASAPVCIPPSQYVQGAEVELQLDTLITWVEEQLRVQR